MRKEILSSVDEFNHPIPAQERSRAIAEKSWRRAAGGLVVDVNLGLVLCHRRSLEKDERPGVWVATFGGKVERNEKPIRASRRELNEEFGITSVVDKFIFMGCYKIQTRHQYEYVFIAKVDHERTKRELNPDPKEVETVQWIKIRECIDYLKNDKSWFSYGYDINILQDLLNRRARSQRGKFARIVFRHNADSLRHLYLRFWENIKKVFK